MKHIHLEETESTNTWVAAHLAELDDMTLVSTSRQSAGRGQRGNSWESEPGMNLTVSMLWRPSGFAASRQFAASEGVALAVADTLGEFGIDARVKWPNDIYVADSKIAGILIEHAVAGRDIMHSVIGIGLNVNQREFRRDAPNPVSMRQLTGRDHDLGEVTSTLSRRLEERLAEAVTDGTALHTEYMSRLWRGDGRMYPFATPSGARFEAAIAGVAPDGMLSLVTADGRTLTFAFKEVVFIL